MFPGLKSNIPELFYTPARIPISLPSLDDDAAVAVAAGGGLTGFVEGRTRCRFARFKCLKNDSACRVYAGLPKIIRLNVEETEGEGEKKISFHSSSRSSPRIWQSHLQAYPIIKEGKKKKKDMKNGWQHFHVCSQHLISPSSLPSAESKATRT